MDPHSIFRPNSIVPQGEGSAKLTFTCIAKRTPANLSSSSCARPNPISHLMYRGLLYGWSFCLSENRALLRCRVGQRRVSLSWVK
jgi:hypothetical protein